MVCSSKEFTLIPVRIHLILSKTFLQIKAGVEKNSFFIGVPKSCKCILEAIVFLSYNKASSYGEVVPIIPTLPDITITQIKY